MTQCLMRALWMVNLNNSNAVDIVIAKAYTEASSLSTFCCWSESRSLKNLQTFWRMGWKGLLQDYQVDSCPYPAARADDRQHHQASSQSKENRKTVNECSISTIMVLIENHSFFVRFCAIKNKRYDVERRAIWWINGKLAPPSQKNNAFCLSKTMHFGSKTGSCDTW